MKYLDLGGSGLRVSAVGLGCMRIASLTAAQLDRHVHGALELGVNFFDHADIYGRGACEESFGRLLESQPGLRQRMALQSKCGIRPGVCYDLSREYILQAAEASLRRLRTDHLDVLLLHRPDALMEPDEVAEAFRQLRAAGKVLHFGVSNFSAPQLRLLQRAVGEPLRANQLQFSLAHCGMVRQGVSANTLFDDGLDRDGGVLDECRLAGMTIQAWSPLQFGMFGGVFLDHPDWPELNEALARLAAQYGVSKAAIAAAWVLRHPAGMQVIAGTASPAHLAELCAGAQVRLTRPEWYELYRAAGNRQP